MLGFGGEAHGGPNMTALGLIQWAMINKISTYSTLPGFMMLLGSSVAFRARIMSRATAGL